MGSVNIHQILLSHSRWLSTGQVVIGIMSVAPICSLSQDLEKTSDVSKELCQQIIINIGLVETFVLIVNRSQRGAADAAAREK